MSRYFSYLMALNLLSNSIAFAPTILLGQRFEGAVLGIAIGTILSTVFIFVIAHSQSQLGGIGFPEMISTLPRWLQYIWRALLGLLIVSAGVVLLLFFIDIVIRFLNPDVSALLLMAVTTIFLSYIVCKLSSLQVMHLMEWSLLLITPFILFVWFQALTSPYLRWDDIVEIAGQWKHTPSLSTLSTSTYLFTGYANIVIFSRLFHVTHRARSLYLLYPVMLVAISVLFFIPIGILGVDVVDHYTFPWIATADSISVRLGPIERVTTIFMVFYIGITLTSIIVHWHVGLNLLGLLKEPSVNPFLRTATMKRSVMIGIIAAMTASMLALQATFTERDIFILAEKWCNWRFVLEVALIPAVVWAARRKVRSLANAK